MTKTQGMTTAPICGYFRFRLVFHGFVFLPGTCAEPSVAERMIIGSRIFNLTIRAGLFGVGALGSYPVSAVSSKTESSGGNHVYGRQKTDFITLDSDFQLIDKRENQGSVRQIIHRLCDQKLHHDSLSVLNRRPTRSAAKHAPLSE